MDEHSRKGEKRQLYSVCESRGAGAPTTGRKTAMLSAGGLSAAGRDRQELEWKNVTVCLI